MQTPELTELVTRLSGEHRQRILTRQEEQEAALAWQNDRDEAARKLIVQTHVKIVAKEVRRMRFYRAEPADLFSEGLLGLSVALDKFDPKAGFRFYTYAIHWIRAKMSMHILLTEGPVKMPNSSKQKRLFFSYRKVMTMLAKQAHKDGREMSRSALQQMAAETLNVTVEDIQAIQAAFTSSSSFDAPISIDGENALTLSDTLADTAPHAEAIIAKAQETARLQADIASAMALLNEREQRIILNRKLAPKEEQMTLEDLSQIYDVSRERIRQVEVVALKKLEKSLAPVHKLLCAA